MIVDLHSHTKYSFCGKDCPEDLVKAMIANGVNIFGITDHNYGIGDKQAQYIDEISELKGKYAEKIKILCGIEICTISGNTLDDLTHIHEYDYCLIEQLAVSESVMKGDIINYTKDYQIPVGIAHTDLFNFIKTHGFDVRKYLKSLAENNIFWELNVNYDSIHNYREHLYVKEFFENSEQQELIKQSGICVSVGFDGHKLEDYSVERVRKACDFLCDKKIKLFVG